MTSQRARASDGCVSRRAEVLTNFNLTHRPTRLPGADPATDREVLCNGRTIARVLLTEQGEKAGTWSWNAMWVSDDNRGDAPSLDEALAEVKRRVTPETLAALPPAR